MNVMNATISHISQIKETFMKQLNDMEEWLYGEGEEATKSVYVSKLGELEKIGAPIVKRYREFEERPVAVEAFRASVRRIVEDATSTVSLTECVCTSCRHHYQDTHSYTLSFYFLGPQVRAHPPGRP